MHREREAILLVILHAHLQQHLDARREALPRGALEVGFQHLVHVGPYGTSRLGKQGITPLRLLHQFDVAVSVVCLAHLAQLGLHPIGIGQSLAQCQAYEPPQFI